MLSKCVLDHLFRHFFIMQIIGHSTLAFLLWLRAQTVDLSNNASTYSFYLFIWKASVIDLLNLMFEFEIKFTQVRLFSSRLTSNYFVEFAVVLCGISPYSLLTMRMNEGTNDAFTNQKSECGRIEKSLNQNELESELRMKIRINYLLKMYHQSVIEMGQNRNELKSK